MIRGGICPKVPLRAKDRPHATSSQANAARLREIFLYFLPIAMRVPLKFGAQVVDSVFCAWTLVVIEGANGRSATGWGETPLAVA